MPKPNYYAIQQALCDSLGRMNFCPEDGYCFHCGGWIWDKIDASEAAGRYITACPICHHSFCE